MRRLWLRWLGLVVFVAVLSTAFVLLGRWQLDRLDQRRDTNDHVAVNTAADPVSADVAWASEPRDGDEWRRVELVGEYLPQHQLVVRYRHLDGAQGFEVVTPMSVGERIILIDRGFVRSSPGTDPAPGAPPSGTVRVVGYLRLDEQGPDKATIPVDGNIRLVNAAAIGRGLGIDPAPGFLQLATSEPAQDEALTPLGLPAKDEGPHLSYALQWFAFTLLAVAGMVVFIRGDLRDRRRAHQRKEPNDGPAAES